MDYVRYGEIQGHSLVFFKDHYHVYQEQDMMACIWYIFLSGKFIYVCDVAVVLAQQSLPARPR